MNILNMLGGARGLWKSRKGQVVIAMVTLATVLLVQKRIDQDTWAMIVGAVTGTYQVAQGYADAKTPPA